MNYTFGQKNGLYIISMDIAHVVQKQKLDKKLSKFLFLDLSIVNFYCLRTKISKNGQFKKFGLKFGQFPKPVYDYIYNICCPMYKKNFLNIIKIFKKFSKILTKIKNFMNYRKWSKIFLFCA